MSDFSCLEGFETYGSWRLSEAGPTVVGMLTSDPAVGIRLVTQGVLILDRECTKGAQRINGRTKELGHIVLLDCFAIDTEQRINRVEDRQTISVGVLVVLGQDIELPSEQIHKLEIEFDQVDRVLTHRPWSFENAPIRLTENEPFKGETLSMDNCTFRIETRLTASASQSKFQVSSHLVFIFEWMQGIALADAIKNAKKFEIFLALLVCGPVRVSLMSASFSDGLASARILVRPRHGARLNKVEQHNLLQASLKKGTLNEAVGRWFVQPEGFHHAAVIMTLNWYLNRLAEERLLDATRAVDAFARMRGGRFKLQDEIAGLVEMLSPEMKASVRCRTNWEMSVKKLRDTLTHEKPLFLFEDRDITHVMLDIDRVNLALHLAMLRELGFSENDVTQDFAFVMRYLSVLPQGSDAESDLARSSV